MTLKINEGRYRFTTTNPGGSVGLFLERKGKQMESEAKKLATSLRLVRTGRYRASITAVLVTEGKGLVLKFGSAVPHARLLEEGTPPHIIRAKPGSGLWWDMPNDRGWMVQPDDGRPVSVVFHPGTPRYQVLHIAALRVLGHRGIVA